uniref:DUF1772-domain-containing protein n=1 Tax=Ditylenchus dipsaci TaxID=166011 RepID=A0A915CPS7_9BILA
MYSRAAPMQSGLALISGAVGSILAYKTGDNRWLVGSALILCNLPFSALFVMPVDKELNDIPNELANKPRITDLVQQWGKLNTVRTVLGVAAVGAFVWT